MHCPFCGNNESRVIDSRESTDGVRRRRECIRCELRFTTYERVNSMPLMIAKRDGRREAFSRDKLARSLQTACAKRPLEVGAISKIVVDIENELHQLSKAEIEARVLGEMCVRFFQNFSMGPVRSVVKVVSPSNFVNTLIRR